MDKFYNETAEAIQDRKKHEHKEWISLDTRRASGERRKLKVEINSTIFLRIKAIKRHHLQRLLKVFEENMVN